MNKKVLIAASIITLAAIIVLGWTGVLHANDENIAWGQKTPEEVVTGWMNSSGHRANILSSKFTFIGVGVYRSSSGRLYWVQLFTG